MCVIIGGLRKNLRRAEQVEGMRSNRYGFSILVLRNKKVVAHQRSLREEDIMKVWDEAKDDDYVLTHSRIPSAGGHEANLEDCHMWQREGCYFAHNGTMTNIIDMMGADDSRTDSLYCFEEIFLPLWKSQGRNFNQLVERTMTAVTHGSRVVIVTPDGEVHYLGKWIDDHDCKMSNISYKTREAYASWNEYKPVSGGAGWLSQPSLRTDAVTGEAARKEEIVKPIYELDDLGYEFDGSLLASFATISDLGRLMLTQIVNSSVEDLAVEEAAEHMAVELGIDPKDEKEWNKAVMEFSRMARASFEKVGPGINPALDGFSFDCAEGPFDGELFEEGEIESVISDYASTLEYECAPQKFRTSDDLTKGILEGYRRIQAATAFHSKALNVGSDWRQSRIRKVFTSWRMLTNRKGAPTVVKRDMDKALLYGREGEAAKTYMRNLQAFYDAIRK